MDGSPGLGQGCLNVRRLNSGEISEEAIQKTVIQWVRSHPYFKGKEGLVLHFPSEGARSPVFGKKLKDMGFRAGIADLLIAMPRRGYGGAWLELKSKKGKLSPAQKEFLDNMQQQNYFTAVCYSIEGAIEMIEWYCFQPNQLS